MNKRLAEIMSLITNIMKTIEGVFATVGSAFLFALFYTLADSVGELGWFGKVIASFGYVFAAAIGVAFGFSLLGLILAIVCINLRKKHMKGMQAYTGTNYLRNDSVIKIIVSSVCALAFFAVSVSIGVEIIFVAMIVWNMAVLIMSCVELYNA